jgi:hypothetical protein
MLTESMPSNEEIGDLLSKASEYVDTYRQTFALARPSLAKAPTPGFYEKASERSKSRFIHFANCLFILIEMFGNVRIRASAPPHSSGLMWSITYPGQAPFGMPVDGQGCCRLKAFLAAVLRL